MMAIVKEIFFAILYISRRDEKNEFSLTSKLVDESIRAFKTQKGKKNE